MMEIKTKARLYTEETLAERTKIVPTQDQAHYLLKVMRAGIGDGVVLFNGKDGEWFSLIDEATKKTCTLLVDHQLRPQIAEPNLWLAFAPLKKTNTDFVVEKATELGVSRLMPVFTERTNTTRVKSERLRMIALEAAEQCDRLSVPEVMEPIEFKYFLSHWPQERNLLVPDETGGGVSLKDTLDKPCDDGETPLYGFLVGPEGGFAASELDALGNLPFVSRVGLGPRILRAETAALAALACFQAMVGDWRRKPRFNNGYFFNARK